MTSKRKLLVLFFLSALARGQEKSDMQQILERLDRLEKENLSLAAEVHALRQELATGRLPAPVAEPAPAISAEEADRPSLDERMAVQEHRTEELAQTKIESAHKLPVSLTGMVLLNAFLNGKGNGGDQYPAVASGAAGNQTGGASLGQTVLGLKFQGPRVLGGGQVSGSLFMDFYAGSNQSLDHLLRIRVASVEIDWKNQSFLVGQDKPIISPREPNSLAQVGESPLTASGNLWLWQPQARFEQRFGFGDTAGLRAQFGVYQTSEAGYAGVSAAPRPGIEGRFEAWHDFGRGRRIEIAPGFHTSSSHVRGLSIPSDIFSVDWLIRPWSRLDFTGMFFSGQNVAVLGSLPQGFTLGKFGVRPVHSVGGWGQVSLRATDRLSFNVYGGEQDDRNSDLMAGQIGYNRTYAGNIMYRLGNNVLASFETSQVRTFYLGSGTRLNNHYDLGLAYLF